MLSTDISSGYKIGAATTSSLLFSLEPSVFIEKLPKTDLHVHLDGSIRISTILELAKKQNVKLPADSAEGLKKIVCCDEDCKSLDEYLRAFIQITKVMPISNKPI